MGNSNARQARIMEISENMVQRCNDRIKYVSQQYEAKLDAAKQLIAFYEKEIEELEAQIQKKN